MDEWDVGNVTDMSSMFNGARSFNSDSEGMNQWDVGNITDMSDMFHGATSFNDDISRWRVGSRFTGLR
jgi:hypothetical protein